MTPDTVLLQFYLGSGDLYALTHFQACIRSFAHSLANIPSINKNPNQSLICARLYQVHCLLSLNYKTTEKEFSITSNKITNSGVRNGWQNSSNIIISFYQISMEQKKFK